MNLPTGHIASCAISILVTFGMFVHPGSVQAQWTVADSSGSAIITGAAAYTPGGYVAISSDLYLSSDLGATWETRTPMYLGQPILGVWTDAYFNSPTEGYMTGGIDLNNQYGILHTIDGGTNWTPVFNPANGPWPRRFNALQFPAPSIGYAVGTNGRVSRTTNGGQTWTDVSSSGGTEITSLHFFSGNTGVIAGENILMRSTTSGVVWTQALSVTGKHVLAATGDIVVACGPDSFHISTNQGIDWITRPAPFPSPSSVHVFSASNIVVVDDLNDALYITRSGGLYWERAVLPVEGDLQAVHFNDALNGCLVGRTGNHSLILRTTTGPGVGIPVATIVNSLVIGCGVTTNILSLAGADPYWSVTWRMNGVLLGYGASAVVVMDSTASVLFEAEVSNGTYTTIIPLQTNVEVFDSFSVDAGDDVFICHGGSAQLSVDLPANASVVWTPSTGLSDPTSAQPVATPPDTSITYTATVTMGNCTASAQVTVQMDPPIPVDPWSSIFTGYDWRYSFVDPFNGFVFTQDTVHRTGDGGASWVSRPLPGYQLGKPNMWDPLFGYSYSAWQVYETHDGWDTYSIVPGLPSGYHMDVYFKSQDTLFMNCRSQYGGSYGKILKSTDRGISWAEVGPGFYQVGEIEFPGGNVIVAAGGFGLNSGRVYRSEDGGDTWQQVVVPTDMHQIFDLATEGSGTLYAAAYADLWRSTDRGATWTKNIVGDNNGAGNYAYVAFQGVDTGYAVLRDRLWQTVNNGACWERMNMPPEGRYSVPSKLANELSFLAATEPDLGHLYRTLYRSRPAAPGVRFTVYDTICAGTAPILVNNSVGYTAFTWSIDGVFHSSEALPVFPIMDPGMHTITLAGANGSGTSEFSKNVFVELFDATPVLSLTEPLCWAGANAHILATTPAPTLGYEWYYQGTVPVQQSYAGHLFDVVTSSNPKSYFAVPISNSMCRGNASEPIEITAFDDIPYLYDPSGSSNVCTWGQPFSSDYSTTPMGGSADITGYVWSITPADAGTITNNGANCTIQWSLGYKGYPTVSAQAVDACGTGPAAIKTLSVDTGNYILVQPTDIVVNIGDPFTLNVQFAAPLWTSGQWYRNGSAVNNSDTYTVQEATPAMAGTYYWQGNVGVECGNLSSDTITVTVLGTTGIGTASDPARHPLITRPNPFDELLFIDVPSSDKRTLLLLLDATGRTVKDVAIPPGPARPIEFHWGDVADGIYTIVLRSPSGSVQARIIKAGR